MKPKTKRKTSRKPATERPLPACPSMISFQPVECGPDAFFAQVNYNTALRPEYEPGWLILFDPDKRLTQGALCCVQTRADSPYGASVFTRYVWRVWLHGFRLTTSDPEDEGELIDERHIESISPAIALKRGVGEPVEEIAPLVGVAINFREAVARMARTGT